MTCDWLKSPWHALNTEPRRRSLVFFQTTCISTCWKVIMEFLLPAPALSFKESHGNCEEITVLYSCFTLKKSVTVASKLKVKFSCPCWGSLVPLTCKHCQVLATYANMLPVSCFCCSISTARLCTDNKHFASGCWSGSVRGLHNALCWLLSFHLIFCHCAVLYMQCPLPAVCLQGSVGVKK